LHMMKTLRPTGGSRSSTRISRNSGLVSTLFLTGETLLHKRKDCDGFLSCRQIRTLPGSPGLAPRAVSKRSASGFWILGRVHCRVGGEARSAHLSDATVGVLSSVMKWRGLTSGEKKCLEPAEPPVSTRRA
jgi:hypothetical protein